MSDFAPLPLGTGRKTGVEIEFGGLTEARATDIARDILGGTICRTGDHALTLSGSALGDLKIYLDTAFRDAASGTLARAGIDLARALIPVEIVTPPLTRAQLPELDQLRAALRDAGATGTSDGLLLGFGLHLNPEIPGDRAADLAPTITAYALLEDRLRYDGAMDLTRRVLPFSDPWPRALVDALAARDDWSRDALFDCYLTHIRSRNHGLDLLPILSHLDPDRVRTALGPDATSARPAWHYRLPDCRIDEPGWTIAGEWARWRLVEQVAADPALLGQLREDWRAYRAALTTTRPDWRRILADRLDRAGLDGAA